MSTNQISSLSSAVNTQVAAEAFLTRLSNSVPLRDALVLGNDNVSRFAPSLAANFSAHVSTIAHIDLSLNETKNPLGAPVLDKSGLSATLFYDQEAQAYTLSI